MKTLTTNFYSKANRTPFLIELTGTKVVLKNTKNDVNETVLVIEDILNIPTDLNSFLISEGEENLFGHMMEMTKKLMCSPEYAIELINELYNLSGTKISVEYLLFHTLTEAFNDVINWTDGDNAQFEEKWRDLEGTIVRVLSFAAFNNNGLLNRAYINAINAETSINIKSIPSEGAANFDLILVDLDKTVKWAGF